MNKAQLGITLLAVTAFGVAAPSLASANQVRSSRLQHVVYNPRTHKLTARTGKKATVRIYDNGKRVKTFIVRNGKVTLQHNFNAGHAIKVVSLTRSTKAVKYRKAVKTTNAGAVSYLQHVAYNSQSGKLTAKTNLHATVKIYDNNTYVKRITVKNGQLNFQHKFAVGHNLKLVSTAKRTKKITYVATTAKITVAKFIPAGVINTNIGNVNDKNFDQRYDYNGTLGYQYATNATSFKLWAPTAKSVNLITYQTTAPNAAVKKTTAMKIAHNVWSVQLTGNQTNTAYAFQLTFPNGKQTVTQDPYSTAVTENGDRSVVLAPAATQVKNFDRMGKFSQPTDAVIYEASVRDLSMNKDSGIADKGTYKGAAESGKTSQGQITGLDYIKSLGVTHVEFLPFNDFNNNEAQKPAPYNWGYEPKNYNVPEGSYSTHPQDPSARIIEMKNMINTYHKNGLRVIQDVVYNHVLGNGGKNGTYDASFFEKTVPGYYFRKNADGSLEKTSGVGNDLATERPMMRKYIVDSVTYWAKNYHIDGFRFDYLGLIDVTTINQVRQALNKIDPSIIMLGEGWNSPSAIPASQRAALPNMNKMPGVSAFNNDMRDTTTGNVFKSDDLGFIGGTPNNENTIYKLMTGSHNLNEKTFLTPSQSINYIAVHDNLTLADKLATINANALTTQKDTPAQAQKRDMLATTIPVLADGTPFVHSGQEFMRTKNGDNNSYNKPDSENSLDYNLAIKNRDVVNYFKQLLALRKSEPAFRLNDYAAIDKATAQLQLSDNVVAYHLQGATKQYVVVLNVNNTPLDFKATDMTGYKLVLTNDSTQTTGANIATKDATVPGIGVNVFAK
ncbi:type I pullulanase [Periweissella cryptocerci]|uniref:Type I pullulanase n=1 Tax=Periweissella cryptocerci TaxID=2506420 RepID=A0A4P6YQR9_9LACO|nr:type I pullulanase [Periweissella cryptocerci]QBO34947.1 type I pullulanase [Periweissella cryptocerci]